MKLIVFGVVMIILFIMSAVLHYLSEDIRIHYVSFYLDFMINGRRLKDYKCYNTLGIIRKDVIDKGD